MIDDRVWILTFMINMYELGISKAVYKNTSYT